MRVLVFDDEAAVGRLVVRIAAKVGLEATSVSDTDAFGKHLRNDPAEVVVLDLQLGNTDGVTQMRLLANMGYAGTLILMSGFDSRVLSTAHHVGQSLGLRVESVLEKPLRVAEVEKVFDRLRSAGRVLSAQRLLQAVSGGELLLHFQPIVSRDRKQLKKLEALVRWEHPAAGMIPPAEFMPIAEHNTPVIDALTDWVVTAAVEAYQQLSKSGVIVPISVNVSTLNLHDLTLPDRLEQRLRAVGMPLDHLCLEITESTAFTDPGRTMDVLSRVRLKGMKLSIDDFGTGYSSFKLLRQMPFSELKIDRSFVSDVTTSRDARVILKSIMDLAANMEMDCVAEGVETEEIAELLAQLGDCNLQGYLIARPMCVEEIPGWLAKWASSSSAETPELASEGRLISFELAI